MPDVLDPTLTPETSTGNTSDEASQDVSLEVEQDRNAVKQWLNRIACAKKKWQSDFDRMKQNMEFVWGLQWSAQKDLSDERYIAYIALRLIQQKVATLYAKNPTAVATRRKRRDFQVWDGNIESLMSSMQEAQMYAMSGMPVPPEIMAVILDFQHGKAAQKLVKDFCETLDILYQYQVDVSKPEFKEQMKQAVRRGVICGVAYARVIMCVTGADYKQPSTTDTKSGTEDRVRRIQSVVTRIDKENLDETSADFQTLRSLINSLGSGISQDETGWPERLEFDFPPATSIIPDERCRNLVDFVAARWIAQEYVLPVEEVNEIFGVEIEVGTSQEAAKEVVNDKRGIVDAEKTGKEQQDPLNRKKVALYEVFDYKTKTRFFVVEGWKDYVLAPESPSPALSGFWNHFALVFNNTEVEEGSDASIFPPSDVQTLLSPAREWNRTREDLRDHRRANSPRYVFREGAITKEEVEAWAIAAPNSITGIKTANPDVRMDDLIVSVKMNPVEEALYTTAPLEQDLMLGANMQQANIGPAQPNVTATVGNIAEQSRMNVSSSNVDDLDGFLTRIAQAGGEMMLQTMSVETVKGIVGEGAVWPDSPESRRGFLNEVYMQIQAASSGRPNQAVDINNFAQIAPVLQAANANPIAIVEKAIKVLDANLDASDFFPVAQPTDPSQMGSPVQQGPPSQAGPPASNQAAQGVPQQPASMVG